jgi:hypothetical protein
MDYSCPPALAKDPQLIKEWDSLSLTMEQALGTGFSGDISPEELHRAYSIQHALREIESVGRKLFAEDPLERFKGAQAVLEIYKSEENGLRHDIRYYAAAFSRNQHGGTEHFAYTARLMLVTATLIAEAARQMNDAVTLREVEVSLECVMTGLAYSDYSSADALSIVLWSELSRIKNASQLSRAQGRR